MKKRKIHNTYLNTIRNEDHPQGYLAEVVRVEYKEEHSVKNKHPYYIATTNDIMKMSSNNQRISLEKAYRKMMKNNNRTPHEMMSMI